MQHVCLLNPEHTVVIASIKQGFDHLPRTLSPPDSRLDHCENGQMVCLSPCNYFDADDKRLVVCMWLDECAQCEPRHACTL